MPSVRRAAVISPSCRSAAGRDCRDAFLGISKTCAKLGITFWEYLGSRLAVPNHPEIPYLPTIVMNYVTPARSVGKGTVYAKLHAVAVQIPLTSLGADVDATQRVLDMVNAPTLLVGHSYGGTVISEVGVDPRVRGLVYVAALAPEPFEDVGALQQPDLPPDYKFPEPCQGFLQFDKDVFVEKFATPGIGTKDPERALVLAVSQKPIGEHVFQQKTRVAAWQDDNKRRWYVVSKGDQIIPPKTQYTFARRMGARITELETGHASPVSEPHEIARVIIDAAASC